jgi:outer membrane receptor protein involved in Fe transport
MPQGRTQTNYILANVFTRGFSWKGDHSLKLGGDMDIVRLPTALNLFQYGQFTFARQEPPGPSNPPIQYQLGRYTSEFADLDSNFFGVFVQDDWKVTPQLTLNLGVRYDIETYQGSYGGADLPDISTYDERIAFLLTTVAGGANAGTVYKSRNTDKNNIQPRLGFNWAPTSDGLTSVRGGWGLFTEGGHDPISTQGTLKSNRASLYVATSAQFNLLSFFPNEPPADLLARFSRISLTSQFPGLFVESAFAHQFTLGVERKIAGDVGVAVDYAGIRSRHNGRDVNVNHPDANGKCPYIASCSAVTVNLSDGRINSDALQVQLRRSFSRRIGFLASYTYLKAKEDGPSTSPYNRDADFGPTGNDVRHHFVGSVSVRLPYDFNFGAVVNLASAFPYNQTAGRDTTGDRIAGSDRSPGITYNSLRGDRFLRTDVRLTKEFKFGERRRAQILAEVFNAFNTVNFNNYTGVETSPFFQQATQALAPFQAQFGVRLDF